MKKESKKEKVVDNNQRTPQQQLIRTLVKTRIDFQKLRKSMDNRLGRKADRTLQDIDNMGGDRFLIPEDKLLIEDVSDVALTQEKVIEKYLLAKLKDFPIYTEWLSNVKGIGTIAAGWIIGEFNIYKADTVSKMWQYAGLNPGLVRGKKRIEISKYKEKDGVIVGEFHSPKGKVESYLVLTDQMIRGDKATPGFVLPYNKNLRTALVGVMGTGFVKAQNTYCMQVYYPYKTRLEQEENKIDGTDKAWKDVSKGHRDHAAIRKMVKEFLKDLYVEWRTLEGLPVRESYQAEYLGHKSSNKRKLELVKNGPKKIKETVIDNDRRKLAN